jgi:hypothetical protein
LTRKKTDTTEVMPALSQEKVYDNLSDARVSGPHIPSGTRS